MMFSYVSKSLLTALVIIGATFYLNDTCLACSIGPEPDFQIKAPGVENCRFTAHPKHIPEKADIANYIQKLAIMQDNDCSGLRLTAEEKQNFRAIIEEYGSSNNLLTFADTVIQHQTSEQYQTFLESRTDVNNDPCDCNEWINTSRYGDWTVYVEHNDCPSENCSHHAPEGCTQYYLQHYDTLIIPSLVALPGLILIIRRLRRKRNA